MKMVSHQNKANKAKSFPIIRLLSLMAMLWTCHSCSDFLESGLDSDQISPETVFNNPATAQAAMSSIYARMRDFGLVSGTNVGTSNLLGVYTDELEEIVPFASEFAENNINPLNSNNGRIWNDTYQTIYETNSLLKGLEESTEIDEASKNNLLGQGLFVRAFLHSLLVEIYGDIPYIKTIDREQNIGVTRTPSIQVYQDIIADLLRAEELLTVLSSEDERVIIDKYAVTALLARIYLYTKNYEVAQERASVLIDNFQLETDLSKVFLKNSSGSIWQLIPIVNQSDNTQEAFSFFIEGLITIDKRSLTQTLIDTFEPGDLRNESWVGIVPLSTPLYFPKKYNQLGPTPPETLEYSIIFRLAEQYLIRAECRAILGNIAGAQSDLNRIRNRAGLTNSLASTTNELVMAILQERRVEFFSEQGHRFFDLKRLGLINDILPLTKSGWDVTDVLFPIPEEELVRNPNLEPQNPGY